MRKYFLIIIGLATLTFCNDKAKNHLSYPDLVSRLYDMKRISTMPAKQRRNKRKFFKLGSQCSIR